MAPEQAPSGNTPPLSPTSTGQYDFIVNSGAAKPHGVLIGGSTKTRVLTAVGGGLVLLIVAWVFVAVLSSTSGFNAQPFITVAQQQAEMAHVAQIVAQASTNQGVQGFATTLQLSIESDQQSIMAYLHQNGAQPNAQIINAAISPHTDATLQAAQSAGTYDQTYVALAQAQLNTYEQELKQAYATTKSTTARQLLNADYTHAQLLLTQSHQQ